MIILALAAVIRGVYLWEYSSLFEWQLLTVDNYYHHNWAQIIAGGDLTGDTTYFRAPFYVFSLGLLYAAFEPGLWVARIFGVVVGLASVGLTYLIANRLLGRKVALWSALVQAIYPAVLYFEAELLLDPLFMLLVQAALYSFIRWFDSQRLSMLALAGVFTGLAAITRPTALLLIPLMLLFMVVRQMDRRTLIRHGIYFVLLASLPVGVTFVRNMAVAGDPVLVASQGGINFYLGNNPDADGVSAVMPEPLGYNWRIKDVSQIAEQDVGRDLTPGEVSDYWTGRTTTWITENPWSFLKLYARKLLFSVGNREISNNRSLPAFFDQIFLLKYVPLSFAFLFPFAIIGAVAAWRKHAGIRLIVSFVVVHTAVIALFFFSSRFRLPIMPYVIMLAMFGIGTAVELLRRNVRTAVATVIGIGCFGAMSVLTPPVHSDDIPVQHLLSEGRYLYRQGDYDDALQRYRSALMLNPGHPEVHLDIGSVFFRLGREDSARFHFAREIDLHPGRADAYANMASLSLVNRDFTGARDWARLAIARKPYDLNANLILIRGAALDTTFSDDSLRAVAAFVSEQSDGNPSVLTEAAAALLDRDLVTQGEAVLMRAVTTPLPPVETDDHAFTGQFWQHRRTVKRDRARALQLFAAVKGMQGVYGLAEDYASQALAVDSSYADAWVTLIQARLALGQMESARTLLQEAVQRFPGHPGVRQLLQ